MIGKVYRKISKILSQEHSMLHHPAEKYYFKQYWRYIEGELPNEGSILEIGCHEGRFTIPLIKKGLKVKATDIKKKYETAIRKSVDSSAFEFKLETIHQSAERKDLPSFDAIMCLELLYTMPDYQKLMAQFQQNMKKGGLFFASHRSKGYYVNRFLKEKKWDELEKIIADKHSVFNGQYSGELLELYGKLGFRVKELIPIGSLSGFGNDPFSDIADPTTLDSFQLEKLSKLENDNDILKHLHESARYFLIIAEKI